MDAHEARQLSEQLARAILENKNVHDVLYNISRILSYLVSEQDEREKLKSAMEKLSRDIWGGDDRPGLGHRLESIEARSEKNGRLLRGLLGSMAAAIGLEVLRLALGHLK